MAKTRFIVIGNGSAGVAAAEELRQGDNEAAITIISAEPTAYLVRHRLASFVANGSAIESLEIREPEWYSERRLQLRLNQPVVKIEPQKKSILLAHRERIPYDKLLIAVGARHRLPERLSRFSPLLTRFNNGVDAIKLKQVFGRVNHVTMLGGDCVGLQVCCELHKKGKKVTLLMDERRFWPLELDEETKDRLAAAIAAKGIEVIRDDYAVEVAGSPLDLTVTTRGGKKISTNVALLSSGMVPNLDFMADSGIDVQDGVLVNAQLESSAAGVYAAGECAQIYHESIKGYRCSTGYVNAALQGKIAARNLLGAQDRATLCEPGHVEINGEKFISYGWKGFSLDEKN
jgi:nitrite reductase (NADH) large subunit